MESESMAKVGNVVTLENNKEYLLLYQEENNFLGFELKDNEIFGTGHVFSRVIADGEEYLLRIGGINDEIYRNMLVNAVIMDSKR